MRCLTLARQLAHSGYVPQFAINKEAISTVPALKASGFELHVWSYGADASSLKALRPQGTDLLVIDDYGLDDRFESVYRDWAKKIIVIDDLANRPHDCDLLIDVTPCRESSLYQELVPNSCKLLLGPDYALLDEKFTALRSKTLARRRHVKTLRRILISFGLTDPAGATAKVLDGILESRLDVAVDVVLNHKAPEFSHVTKLSREYPNINLIEYAWDMPELMTNVDLAFGAAGTTSWERCCLGLPTILMVVADNQEFCATCLEAYGAAVNLGRVEKVRSKDIASVIHEIAHDKNMLFRISMAAAEVCDGKGATRIALSIHPATLDKSGEPVRFRLSHNQDMDIMFQWQRHPETRRFSRNPAPPSRKEHMTWFRRKMLDNNCDLLMITRSGRDVGIFRRDHLANGRYEVSIVIAPEFRGQGIGRATLQFANEFWPGDDLQAEILPDNYASQILFKRAGYEKVGERFYLRKALIK